MRASKSVGKLLAKAPNVCFRSDSETALLLILGLEEQVLICTCALGGLLNKTSEHDELFFELRVFGSLELALFHVVFFFTLELLNLGLKLSDVVRTGVLEHRRLRAALKRGWAALVRG